MSKYRVRGTIEQDWEVVVEADSQDEALDKACDLAEAGIGIDGSSGHADDNYVHVVLADE